MPDRRPGPFPSSRISLTSTHHARKITDSAESSNDSYASKKPSHGQSQETMPMKVIIESRTRPIPRPADPSPARGKSRSSALPTSIPRLRTMLVSLSTEARDSSGHDSNRQTASDDRRSRSLYAGFSRTPFQASRLISVGLVHHDPVIPRALSTKTMSHLLTQHAIRAKSTCVTNSGATRASESMRQLSRRFVIWQPGKLHRLGRYAHNGCSQEPKAAGVLNEPRPAMKLPNQEGIRWSNPARMRNWIVTEMFGRPDEPNGRPS